MVVNGHTLTMELDAGAAVSVISDKMRREFFPTEKLDKSTVMLKMYTDEPMKVMGVLYYHVSVTVNKRQSWH